MGECIPPGGPTAGQPAAVTIAAEQPDQFDAIRAVVAAAFADEPAVADLVEALRGSPGYRPELALVATAGAEAVGFVMVTEVQAVEDSGPTHRLLSLSPLAVTPGWQRRGVGAALVRQVLQAADALGEPVVVVEGSPNYYPRFGFRPAADVGISMTLPEWAPPEAAMACRLARFDRKIRGRLVYPPAFDVLDS